MNSRNQLIVVGISQQATACDDKLHKLSLLRPVFDWLICFITQTLNLRQNIAKKIILEFTQKYFKGQTLVLNHSIDIYILQIKERGVIFG